MGWYLETTRIIASRRIASHRIALHPIHPDWQNSKDRLIGSAIPHTMLTSYARKNITPAADTVMASQLLVPAYSDVQLVVGEERLPAHKCILCPSSVVFRKMFEVPMREASSNEVQLDGAGWRAPMVKEALRYLYTGSLQDSILHDMALELLAFSRTYEITKLKSYVEGYCMQALTKHNVKKILAAAMKMGCKKLRKGALQYIADNSRTLMADVDFLDGISNAHCREILFLQGNTPAGGRF